VLRTSEGGAEEISVYRVEDLASALTELRRKRFTVIGTDVFGKNVYTSPVERSRRAIVLGSERSGLSPRVRESCDRLVKIPGAGTSNR